MVVPESVVVRVVVVVEDNDTVVVGKTIRNQQPVNSKLRFWLVVTLGGYIGLYLLPKPFMREIRVVASTKLAADSNFFH